MKLTKVLRERGYDLIDGPIRNHKLLQLWLHRGLMNNDIEQYFIHIDKAFTSPVKLSVIQNNALSVDATITNEYSFNIGISMLEDILSAIGFGELDLSSEIKSGKKVSISYNNSLTREVTLGDLENYLANCDFRSPNKRLLKNANRDNILVITGVLLAKNLVVEIETDFSMDAGFVAGINKVADGKLDFSLNNSKNIKMVSSGDAYFPIAVMAHRIDFDKGHFSKTKLVTDNRYFF